MRPPVPAIASHDRSPSPSWFTVTMIGAACVVVAINVARVVLHLRSGDLVATYKQSLYWVDYREGFVRRGLPGEALALLSGESVTQPGMVFMAVAISGAAGIALFLLVVGNSFAEEARDARLTLQIVVLCAPFTVPLMVRDVGRYDAVGVVALAVVALAPRVPWRAPWPATFLSSMAVAAACASEEFLFAFLVPVGFLAADKLASGSRRHTALITMTILGPGAVVSVWSLVSRPSSAFLDRAVLAAQNAGMGPTAAPGGYAATQLAATIDEQFELLGRLEPVGRVVLPVGLCCAFLVMAVVVWNLAGRPRPMTLVLVTAWLAMSAGALGLIGIDFLRWWSLAACGFVAALAVVPRAATVRRPTWRGRAVSLALMAMWVALQDVPIAAPLLDG